MYKLLIILIVYGSHPSTKIDSTFIFETEDQCNQAAKDVSVLYSSIIDSAKIKTYCAKIIPTQLQMQYPPSK
jgi:hypothetical protein